MTFQIPADPASDARYRVEASADLVSWSTFASKDGAGPWSGFALVAPNSPVAGFSRITVTENLSLDTGNRFHRLEADKP